MLSDLALAAVVYFGAREVASGTTSAGTLVAFVLYLELLFGPIQQLSQVFDGYQQARVGLLRIADLLATPSSIETLHPEQAVPIAGRLRGEVDLDDIRFRYGGASEDALADISPAHPGRCDGRARRRTGAGKSTIVKLLARFYDPSDGAVRVDGVDLRRYDLPRYRSRIGVVPQEAHLFTGDVASNIAFGRPVGVARRDRGRRPSGRCARDDRDPAARDASARGRAGPGSLGGAASARRTGPRAARAARPAAARRGDRHPRSRYRAARARLEPTRSPAAAPASSWRIA